MPRAVEGSITFDLFRTILPALLSIFLNKGVVLFFVRAPMTRSAISINGFMSVVGSVIALPITLFYGFNNLFWLALSGYILTGLLTVAFFKKIASS